MENSKLGKIDYQIKKNQKFNIGNNQIKTTNINILLNRVRQKNKNKSKKKNNFINFYNYYYIIYLHLSFWKLVNIIYPYTKKIYEKS
mgnify:CR=1 FL=1